MCICINVTMKQASVLIQLKHNNFLGKKGHKSQFVLFSVDFNSYALSICLHKESLFPKKILFVM